eukprot:SAG31_NODE_14510_length_802_cov_1.584637_2_plen_86_part_01
MLLPLLATAAAAAAAAAKAPLMPEWPCYVQTRFARSQIQVVGNVTYGSAFDKLAAQQRALTLDAYLPPEPAATAPPRPAVVLIHGG